MYSTLVLGTVSGLVAVRQALLSELTETAQAILALNQSYSFSGVGFAKGSSAGSAAGDSINTISLGSTNASPQFLGSSPAD
jgi:hypothetical protein